MFKYIATITLAVFCISAQANNFPPEAIAACADLGQGDLCSFTNAQGININGSCHNSADGESKMGCVPN